MAARYELEARIISATGFKNVNRRHGELKPHAVVWVEPQTKCATYADVSGGASYSWDQKLLIPFSTPIVVSTLHVDVMHDELTVGSAEVALRGVGLGLRAERMLQLMPQGEVEVELSVRKLGGGIRNGKGSGVDALAGAFGGIVLTDDDDAAGDYFGYDEAVSDDDDDADADDYFGYYECGTEDEDSDDANDGTEADDDTDDDYLGYHKAVRGREDDDNDDNDTDDDCFGYRKAVRVREVDANDCYFGYYDGGAFRGAEDFDDDGCFWDDDEFYDGLEDDAYFDEF